MQAWLVGADAVRADLGGSGRGDGHGHTFPVDAQAEEVNALAHGCLVPFLWAVAVENIGPDQTGGAARSASAPQATHVDRNHVEKLECLQ